MKKLILMLALFMGAAVSLNAQSWKQLTDEEKMMKLQDFRADNQKYMKEKLGLKQEQLDDIDNVNICYLSTLDRIDRYAKDDATKEKYAKTATQARSAQLDAIMGSEKRKQFQAYVQEKLKKAGVIKQ